MYKISLFVSALVLVSCSSTTSSVDDSIQPSPIPVSKIELYQTKTDKSVSLQKQTPKVVTQTPLTTIEIKPEVQYQEIEGVGASLTHSSAYVLSKNITATQRQDILKDLFTKNGIGIDYLRLTIGASDFSYSGNFSLNDTSNDIDMTHFNFDTDKDYFLPVLKEITQNNANLHLLGTPWSPPAWMKTNSSMVGGELKPEFYQAHANYLTKYVQEMSKQGFNITALTIQNEPLYDKAAYPCMLMTAEQQRDFIKNNLGPTFTKNNIKTQIITYDHNWDHPEYGITILADKDAAQYVTGTGFHAYAGNVTAMGQVHAAFPDKGIYFTEQSGGGWAPNYGDNIRWNTETLIIDGFRNWTKNVLLWNLALDEKSGPTNKGCLDCRGVVTVSSTGQITKNEEYYVLGHVGKFLQKGAKRCESNNTEDKGIKNVSICNPDGSVFVIATNFTGSPQAIQFKKNNQTITLEMDNQSVYTIKFAK